MYKDREDGVSAEDFQNDVQEEYRAILSKSVEMMHQNPTFFEQLTAVVEFHQ
jgi:hypothetical protein